MKLYEQLFGVESPVVLVTGSSAPRVGQTIAQLLAEQGCTLAIHGNTSLETGESFVNQLNAEGHPAALFGADLKNPESPGKLVREVIERFGRLDVVVNSAAIWYPTPFQSVSHSEIEQFAQVNSTASFMIAKFAGEQMAKQEKGGVIINVGDWATIRPYTNYSAYFLSKGNLDTMTRLLAVELASLNSAIRVNAVMPGPVMIPDELGSDLKEQIINATLLKREGSPQNVANACRCLIENDFITGVCLPVDGGRSVYSPYNPV